MVKVEIAKDVIYLRLFPPPTWLEHVLKAWARKQIHGLERQAKISIC
jgi:hypothetical protein